MVRLLMLFSLSTPLQVNVFLQAISKKDLCKPPAYSVFLYEYQLILSQNISVSKKFEAYIMFFSKHILCFLHLLN